MFEKEAIRHAFEVTIGLDCLIKPAEEFTYEELNDHLQEKADDFQDGAEFGYNKAKRDAEEKQSGMTILPTAQFMRMDWNEDKLWSLIKRLKNDERTKDLFIFSEDKFGRFDFTYIKKD